MYDAAVVGTATEDVFVTVPSSKLIHVADLDSEQSYLALAYGAKLTVDRIFLSVGGGSTNTASGLSAMGLRTLAVAKVGRDGPAERIERRLQELGVDTSHFCHTDEYPTGLSVILTGHTGDRSILTYRGASQRLVEAEVPWEALRAVPWLHVGSLTGDSAPLFLRLAQFAGEHGLRVSMNPGSAQLNRGWKEMQPALECCTALFLNREEAYRLTGVAEQRGEQDDERVFEILLEAGCRNVFITDGPRGAQAHDGQRRYRIPAYQAPVVSTVGAGDAFASGALTALIKGEGVQIALEVGSMNAASVLQTMGANRGLLTWELARKLIEQAAPGDPCPIHPQPEEEGCEL